MTTFYPTDPEIYKEPTAYWWELEGQRMAQCVFDTAQMLRDEQTYIRARYRKAIELYENCDCQDLDAWRFATEINVDGPYQFNLIESIVDTIHAEIISQKTKPQFITFGGDWDAQQKAEDLTRFIGGVFSRNKVHEDLAPNVCCDALVFGTGIAKNCIVNETEVRCYRVFPWNLIFDDIEASNCRPLQMFEENLLSRHLLRKEYEEDTDAMAIIERAPEHLFKARPRRTITDLIEVIEAWKIGTDKHHGRHVIACKNGILLDEEFTKEDFPFVFLRYKTRRKGFLGKGIPEILEGQQEVINDLHERINSQLMGASPFIWVKPGSQLRESALTNEIWRVIESEEQPQYVAFGAVGQDLFIGVEKNIEAAQNAIGVNQTMLESAVPAGLANTSGKALRTYNDTKSKRFMRFAGAYEQFQIDLGLMQIDLIGDVVESGEHYVVNAQDDGALLSLDYKDIKLPRNDFVIRPFPTNFLQDTPSGRMADIETLSSIAPESIKPYLFRLLQNPDIEAVTSRIEANSVAVQRIITKLLKDPKADVTQMPPTPYMDLHEALQIVKQAIVDAQSRNAPDDRVQRLISWSLMAQHQIEDMEAKLQQQQMMMMQQMQAQAPQQVPPQSPPLS